MTRPALLQVPDGYRRVALTPRAPRSPPNSPPNSIDDVERAVVIAALDAAPAVELARLVREDRGSVTR